MANTDTNKAPDLTRYCRIERACEIGGAISKTQARRLISSGAWQAKKSDGILLIEIESILAWQDSLPDVVK